MKKMLSIFMGLMISACSSTGDFNYPKSRIHTDDYFVGYDNIIAEKITLNFVEKSEKDFAFTNVGVENMHLYLDKNKTLGIYHSGIDFLELNSLENNVTRFENVYIGSLILENSKKHDVFVENSIIVDANIRLNNSDFKIEKFHAKNLFIETYSKSSCQYNKNDITAVIDNKFDYPEKTRSSADLGLSYSKLDLKIEDFEIHGFGELEGSISGSLNKKIKSGNKLSINWINADCSGLDDQGFVDLSIDSFKEVEFNLESTEHLTLNLKDINFLNLKGEKPNKISLNVNNKKNMLLELNLENKNISYLESLDNVSVVLPKTSIKKLNKDSVFCKNYGKSTSSGYYDASNKKNRFKPLRKNPFAKNYRLHNKNKICN